MKAARRKRAQTPPPMPPPPDAAAVRLAAQRELLSLALATPYPPERRRGLRLGNERLAQQFVLLLTDDTTRKKQLGIMLALGLTNAEYLEALVDLCRGEEVMWTSSKAVA